jgi:hypothetical protein
MGPRSRGTITPAFKDQVVPLGPRLRPQWVRISPRRNGCNDRHPQFVPGRPTAWPPGRVLPPVSRHFGIQKTRKTFTHPKRADARQ